MTSSHFPITQSPIRSCIINTWMFHNSACVTLGPFLEGPERFSHPDSRMIKELLCLHVLNTNVVSYGQELSF